MQAHQVERVEAPRTLYPPFNAKLSARERRGQSPLTRTAGDLSRNGRGDFRSANGEARLGS
jgi:hypothetical protein